MTEFIQISTTVDSEPRARRIAGKLLEQRLSSCVQVAGPIRSSYWWNGKIEHANEWLCLVKARKTDYHRIETTIKQLHAYKVPEILAFPIIYGNDDYLKWIRNETNIRPRVPPAWP